MKNFAGVVKELKKQYTQDFFAEAHDRDPYKVLVACILSLRTKDETTYPAAERLFRLAGTPGQMIKLTPKKIQDAIYPVGFYRRKSETIISISRLLVKEYNSRVPDTIDELVKFRGVGRKTANIVVTFGYNKQGIAVDVHVNRIANRLGWVDTRTPEQTEQELRRILPKRYWIPINELLVRHGQSICKPVSPFCSRCFIRKYCRRNGVERFR